MKKLPQPISLDRKFWRWFLLITLIFFVGNLFWRLPSFLQAVQKPFKSADSSFANAKAPDFSVRSNLLIITKEKDSVSQVEVVSYDPAGKQITFLALPIETAVATRLGEEVKLRDICQKEFKECFWESAILAGTTLEGYLIFDEGEISKDRILAIRKNLFSPGFFLGIFATKDYLDENLRTNLSSRKLYDAASKLKGVTTENISFLNLDASVVDGKFDEEKVASQTKDIFLDFDAANEAASIKIINGTNITGLGSSFKRVVDNLGGRVLAVGSTKNDTTAVFVHSEKTKLANKLADFLGVKVQVSSESSEADVEIVLGQDLLGQIGFD